MTVINMPVGDLARTVNHEANSDWPTMIEVVAYWSKGNGRRGRRRSIKISAEQFFGTGGGYNAPLTGDQIVGMIEKLRRQG